MANVIKLEESEMLGKKPDIPMPDNGYIAGGAVRCWFKGRERVSDYDLFFSSKDSLEKYKESFLKDCKIIRSEESIFECLLGDKKIQLIKRKYYKNIDELFSDFDFHLCQFALNKDGIFTTKEAILSVLRSTLSFNNCQKGFEVDTLRRAFKYAQKGYMPCIGTIANLGSCFVEVSDIDKQIEFYPDGKTRRLKRFD